MSEKLTRRQLAVSIVVFLDPVIAMLKWRRRTSLSAQPAVRESLGIIDELLSCVADDARLG